MRPFFKDDDFNYLTEIALGAAYHQASDVGEVLATIERVHNGDPGSWAREWTATADQLAAEGTANAAAGRSRSAAALFLRASLYYSLASSTAEGTADAGLFSALWEKHRGAWDQFARLTEPPAGHIEIPYQDTTLPGYFFRPGQGAKTVPAGPSSSTTAVTAR